MGRDGRLLGIRSAHRPVHDGGLGPDQGRGRGRDGCLRRRPVSRPAGVVIDGAFYPCSHEMHTGLAEMYVADPRFAANHERVASGLAQYVHDAILANAARHRG